MYNVVKRITLLIATLIMLISFGCSSAFAASCLFGHKAVATPSVEATCTENGSYGGTYCSKCGTVLAEPTVVPAIGHTKREIPSLNPATVKVDGAYVYSCINCNVAIDSVAIPKVETVKLSTTKCTYNGKVRKPTVTVKDTAGKVLVVGQDYDVVYPSGMKMPGKYEVTVSFKGNYSGEKKLSFTIAPKATTGVKAKTATASFITLEWSKTTGATGYEVYKYNSSTKKYEKMNSVTSNSYKVIDLKADTAYKFKIRAYTKAADGTVIYGGYSSIFSAKTTYGVSLTGSSATIYIGATKQLKATTAPANKTLTWKSSNTSVAKVSSSGKVTAVKNGTATITASFAYNGKTYNDTYKITVKTPSIKLSETTATITEGKTLMLTATVDPADIKVTWKSGNTSVATVSSNGEVAAKKEGTAKITASITYKGKTYKKTCDIEVERIEYGHITGNVTYYKNNEYHNNAPDTGTKVFLITTDGRALDLDCKNTYFNRWTSDAVSLGYYNEYGIYATKVDGKGEYNISGVPAGEYILFMISGNTQDCPRYFYDPELYGSHIKNKVSKYLNPEATEQLVKEVLFDKYCSKVVTIRGNTTTYYSYDFGKSYTGRTYN